MVQGLLLIVGIYTLAGLSVQAVYRITSRSQAAERNTHYVLHTHNDGRHLEWAIRSLTLYSMLRGHPITITILDQDSTDDTVRVASLMSRRYGLEFCRVFSDFSMDSNTNTTDHSYPNPSTYSKINSSTYSKINTSTDTSINSSMNARMNTESNPDQHLSTNSRINNSPYLTPPIIHIQLSNPTDWSKLPLSYCFV